MKLTFLLSAILSLPSLAFIDLKVPSMEEDFFQMKSLPLKTEFKIIEVDGIPTYRIEYITLSYQPQTIQKSMIRLVDEVTLEKETYIQEGKVKTLLEKYNYDKESEQLTHIDSYNDSNQVITRKMNSPLDLMPIEIHYSYESKREKKAFAFDVFVRDTNKLLYHYDQNKVFDLKTAYPQSSQSELDKKLKNLRNSKRLKVALIDSGLDHHHPALAEKLAINFNDPIDGIDNDQNGFVDDYIGLQALSGVGFPLESIRPDREIYPLSHGTHVGHIMVSGVSNVALFPFVGEYGEAYFLKQISDKITDEKIDFVNMSFSFPHWSLQDIPKKTFMNLKFMILKNKETLFFAAAGNDYQRVIHYGRNGVYPASFPMENILTVGALNTATFSKDDAHTYNVADYSNISNLVVDIFAPGTDILAASLGGGLIKHSGTSMATPWMVNQSIKLKKTYPELTNRQIRDLFLYTAYIPNIDEPLPCSSGGMVFPTRAHALAKRFLKNKTKSIKELALEMRAQKELLLQGEESNANYLEKLQTLWKMRLL
ncbi:S8 family serine peptidase [Halobacteriovorax sp. GB3]|uniref:S8 family serine peptidase n=1 Tax=Halobacteriovorax sp. GB3 TaxID=2719615 RepID=UPI002362A3EB|nr:S8 family serine peptidase [Halobacteriovorax sp. GB3]MDD0853914.1 S8 family serine peptidase [Halobacteriovorax sp. GB3]